MNSLVLEIAKVKSRCYLYSQNYNEAGKINCISRRDHRDKNLFVEKTDTKSRWNLYSQIAIENDQLICSKESYILTDICNDLSGLIGQQTCTLLDTNEVVDISFDYIS